MEVLLWFSMVPAINNVCVGDVFFLCVYRQYLGICSRYLPFGKELFIRFLPYIAHVICLFVILVISHSGFEGRHWFC